MVPIMYYYFDSNVYDINLIAVKKMSATYDVVSTGHPPIHPLCCYRPEQALGIVTSASAGTRTRSTSRY